MQIKKGKKNPSILLKEAAKLGAVRRALKIAEIEAIFKTVRGGILLFTAGSKEYRKLLACIKN